jgi:hypothetical protein
VQKPRRMWRFLGPNIARENVSGDAVAEREELGTNILHLAESRHRSQRSVRPPHVWMAPTCKSYFREEHWSLAVMCPAFRCRSHMTAGLDGFRGSRPYQLVGSGITLRRSGFSRSVGSTDCTITCFSLSRVRGTPQLSWLCCHCCVSVDVWSAHGGPSHASRREGALVRF